MSRQYTDAEEIEHLNEQCDIFVREINENAIEISRLRAEIERLTALAQSNDDITWELTVENERLRGIERFVAEAARHERDGLRADNERLQFQVEIGKNLTAEIERLRAALQRIADDGKNCQDYCRNQARRALEPKP